MPTAQHFLKTESFSKLWEHVGLSGAGSSDCLLMYIFLLSLSNTRINDGRIVCLLQTLQSKSMQLPCMNLYPKHLLFLSWCVHPRLISELLVSFHTFINWTTHLTRTTVPSPLFVLHGCTGDSPLTSLH